MLQNNAKVLKNRISEMSLSIVKRLEELEELLCFKGFAQVPDYDSVSIETCGYIQ